MKTELVKAHSETLATLYSNSEKPAMRTSEIVACALRRPRCIEAQIVYLNGESPNGNTIMDRKDLAAIVRDEAVKIGTPIPDNVKNNKLARIIMQQQKRSGVPVQRSGRLAFITNQPQLNGEQE